jgi:hypothetical protein
MNQTRVRTQLEDSQNRVDVIQASKRCGGLNGSGAVLAV